MRPYDAGEFNGTPLEDDEWQDESQFTPKRHNSRKELNHEEPHSIRKAHEILFDNRYPEQVKRARMVLAIWQERMNRKAERLGFTPEAAADVERPEVSGSRLTTDTLYEWEGQTYTTYSAAARDSEHSRDMIQKWITQGFKSYAEVLAATPKREIVFEDVEYDSYKAMGDALGINHGTAREWVMRGYTKVEHLSKKGRRILLKESA